MLLALKTEEGATAKECMQLVEAERGKEIDSPLEPPKGTNPPDTLTLAPETDFELLTSRAVR